MAICPYPAQQSERKLRGWPIALSALLLTIGFAPNASAAIVGSADGVVSYKAAPLERNTVFVTVDGGSFVIRDESALIVAGDGCSSVDLHAASCPRSGVERVSVALLDQDDSVSASPVRVPATVDGGDGADRLIGGAENDVLRGGPGAFRDVLLAGEGNDTVDGGHGPDLLDGGTGADLVSYARRINPVRITLDGVADDGEDVDRDGVFEEGDEYQSIEDARGGQAADTIVGSDQANALYGGPGDDVVDGLAADDALFGDGGVDVLTGGSGDDLLDGGAEADTLDAGAGLDTVSYGERQSGVTVSLDGVRNDGAPGESDWVKPDVENVLGGNGSDVLTGDGGDNRLRGGPGYDRLAGGAGSDFLSGGADHDTVTYADRVAALALSLDDVANDGSDANGDGQAEEADDLRSDVEEVIGGDGDDRLEGSGAANVLNGGGGRNTLSGAGGDDTLTAGSGPDLFDGGGGSDRVTYATRHWSVSVTLDGFANDGGGGEGDNVGSDVETVEGGTASDALTGGAGDDALFGGDGDDVLAGGGGADTLDGGRGADELDGGTGADSLSSDSGNDQARGGDGDDVIDGGDGADDLDGGPGRDQVSYAGWWGVHVSLDDVANDGGNVWAGVAHEGDNVRSSIETVEGSARDDVLAGSASAETLSGGDGDDAIDGGAGDDTLDGGFGGDVLDGGPGSDIATYSGRTEPLQLSLDGERNDGNDDEDDYGSGLDRLGGTVEGLVGGSGDDELVGSPADNALDGGPGDDVITGGLGADMLIGAAGQDMFHAQDGVSDSIEGGPGDDGGRFDPTDVLTSIESRPPVNVAAPTISGRTTVGETLTAAPGRWEGSPPISYAYRWQRCDGQGVGCTDILGATQQSYKLTVADLAKKLRVVVAASNDYGGASATSSATPLVATASTDTIDVDCTAFPTWETQVQCAAALWLLGTESEALASMTDDLARYGDDALRRMVEGEGIDTECRNVPLGLARDACYWAALLVPIAGATRDAVADYVYANLIGYVFYDEIAPVDCTNFGAASLAPIGCTIVFKTVFPPETIPNEREYLADYAQRGLTGPPPCSAFGGSIQPLGCDAALNAARDCYRYALPSTQLTCVVAIWVLPPESLPELARYLPTAGPEALAAYLRSYGAENPDCPRLQDQIQRLACDASVALLEPSALPAERDYMLDWTYQALIEYVYSGQLPPVDCTRYRGTLPTLACAVGFQLTLPPEALPGTTAYLGDYLAQNAVSFAVDDRFDPIDCSRFGGLVQPLACAVAFGAVLPPDTIPPTRDYLAEYLTLGRLAPPRCERFGGAVMPLSCDLTFNLVFPASVYGDVSESLAELQTGVIAATTGGSVDPERAATVRGKLITRDGSPLSGVSATVVGHPEFGTATTGVGGDFALRVNGGGWLRFRLEKPGYFPAERQIKVQWATDATLPEVALVPPDSNATDIDLDGPTGTVQVARSEPVTDADGTRRTTLMFPKDVRADMTLPDGSRVTLPRARVRSTEYTVGTRGDEAMPAGLPASSAYTFAVELSVDEAIDANATTVRFSKPVINYTENFLGFPVGRLVPVGWYDRRRGAWVPSDGLVSGTLSTNGQSVRVNADDGSGRVVKIIAIRDGLAELDVDGSGVAASASALTDLGVTDDEREQLAKLYTVGQSLWRVPITHFTPYDFNWPSEPPGDAVQPDAGLAGTGATDKPCPAEGSIIGCENQTLGEALPLTGSEFSLVYQSERQPGFAGGRDLEIPVTPASVPPSLERVEIAVDVAGVHSEASVPAAPNQTYRLRWDGKNAAGEVVRGTTTARLRLGYVYRGTYETTSRFAFNTDGTSTRDRARQEVTIWRDQELKLTNGAPKAPAVGGWDLDVHHVYDTRAGVLFRGDGTRRSGDTLGYLIAGAAGTGVSGFGGDGGPAVQAQLREASDVAAAPDGAIYIADRADHRIRRLNRDGTLVTVAGDGICGARGDGFDSRDSRLCEPEALEFGPDGSLYFLDGRRSCALLAPDCRRIRRISPRGVMTTSHRSPQASSWRDLATAPDGTMYVADGDCGIVMIQGDGREMPFAGSYTTSRDLTGAETYRCYDRGFGGDGGPARRARLSGPQGVAVGPDGTVYIADTGNVRIRAVGPDGEIRSVAGNGLAGSSGDGGSATEASLRDPRGLAVGDDGSLLIVDSAGARVRTVGPDETIDTAAGTGAEGSAGDGANARDANLGGLSGLALSPDGDVYLAMGSEARVRRLVSPLPKRAAGAFMVAEEDGSIAYEFDRSGRHIATHDTLTGATIYRFGYDAAGRLVTVTDGDDNRTVVERDAAGRATAIVAPFGQRTLVTEGATGYLDAVEGPDGARTAFTYEPGGLLASLTDAKLQQTTFTYDEAGRLIKDEDPAGGYKQLSRSGRPGGAEATLTTALGRRARYSVQEQPDGRTRRLVTDAAGHTTETFLRGDESRTTVSPDGTVSSITQQADPRFGMQAPFVDESRFETPGGRAVTVSQDRTVQLADPLKLLTVETLSDTVTVNGRSTVTQAGPATRPGAAKRITTSSPAGRTSAVEIDEQGRPLRIETDGYEPSGASYDSRGLLTSRTQGNRGWSYAYNANGTLASQTDSLQQTTSYTYDAVGRVKTQTLPGGRVIGFDYDANGNLTAVTPPTRPKHGFAHTPVGLVEDYTAPALAATDRLTRYTWNKDRQLDLVTRPGGQTIDPAYDSAGRLASVIAGNEATTYAYSTETGQLAGAAVAGGSALAYTFDGPLPLSEALTGPVAGTASRTYDDDLRPASTSVNGGHTVTFGYDPDSLLTRAGALTITRDPLVGGVRQRNGLIDTTTLGSITTDLDYSRFGEVSAFNAASASAALYTASYTRDDGGRIAQKTETTPAGTHIYAYTYDAAGRLTDVARDGVAHSHFGYDPNGNRTSCSGGPCGAGVSATYDDQDRLVAHGAATYEHSAAGERTAKQVGSERTTYDWNGYGQLRGVELPSGRRIDYLIDAEGRRIGRKVDGQFIQGFLYGREALGPLAQLDGTGNVVARFVYGTSEVTPDYMVKAGTTYRIVSDERGSPRVVVDADTGQVAQELDYDAFGAVTRDTNPGFQPFGFTGGLYDSDTGLVHLQARDYDPETGRFISKDPIGFEGGDTNLYGYVLGDPVNLVDPSGLIFDKVSNFAAGALNSLTLGVSNGVAGRLFDFDPDCADWGAGYGAGAFAGDFNPRGLVKRGLGGATRGFAQKRERKEVRGKARLGGLSPEQQRQFGRYLEELKSEGIRGTKNERGDFTPRELDDLLDDFKSEHGL